MIDRGRFAAKIVKIISQGCTVVLLLRDRGQGGDQQLQRPGRVSFYVNISSIPCKYI